MYDLVIKNGNVIDPQCQRFETRNLAVKDGKIVPYNADMPAKEILDAGGGYVSPGFVEFHAHVYQGSSYGMNPDLLFPYGVTTVVDQGTTGYINFEDFYHESELRTMKIKSFINIFPIGQPGGNIPELLDEEILRLDLLEKTIEKYKRHISGIKIKFSKNTVGNFGIAPLQKALAFADQMNLPLCVHTTNPPIDTEELVSLLRPGDIYCHAYQGHGQTILSNAGSVKEAFWKAKKRGVIIDVANGRLNFDYKIAIPALKEKFLPDIIATDLTKGSFTDIQMPMARNLPFVMSKYLNLGMSLEDILAAVTINPLRILSDNKLDIGALSIGSDADICVFDVLPSEKYFFDANKEKRRGTQYIVPRATIVNGVLTYLKDS